MGLCMAKKVTKVRGMTPLQALIRDQMERKGWEPRDVEDRGVKHATLHRYMQPIILKQLPRKSVLLSLAGALSLDVEDVLAAAVASLETAKRPPWRDVVEFPPTESGLSVGVLVDRIDRLPVAPEDIEEAKSLVRSHLAAAEVVAQQDEETAELLETLHQIPPKKASPKLKRRT